MQKLLKLFAIVAFVWIVPTLVFAQDQTPKVGDRIVGEDGKVFEYQEIDGILIRVELPESIEVALSQLKYKDAYKVEKLKSSGVLGVLENFANSVELNEILLDDEFDKVREVVDSYRKATNGLTDDERKNQIIIEHAERLEGLLIPQQILQLSAAFRSPYVFAILANSSERIGLNELQESKLNANCRLLAAEAKELQEEIARKRAALNAKMTKLYKASLTEEQQAKFLEPAQAERIFKAMSLDQLIQDVELGCGKKE